MGPPVDAMNGTKLGWSTYSHTYDEKHQRAQPLIHVYKYNISSKTSTYVHVLWRTTAMLYNR
jgi:hypothetical protein